MQDRDKALCERLLLVDQYVRKLNPNATIGLHCHEAAARLTALAGALERLGSMEAFVESRPITKHDAELIARIDFARAALATPEAE